MNGNEIGEHFIKHVAIHLQKEFTKALSSGCGCMVPIVLVLSVLIFGVKSLAS